MKSQKFYLIVVVTIAILLAGCSGQIEVIPKIHCDNTECNVTIASLHSKETHYTITVSQESEGTPIGEKFRYPGTTAERHEEWYIQTSPLYQLTDTIMPGEEIVHNFEMSYGTGQTLVIAHVQTPATSWWRTNYGKFYSYTIVEFPGKDNPIKNTLSCRVNGKVIARTEIEADSKIGTKTMGLYLNNNLEEPVATFQVHEGYLFQISYDIPEGTYLIELDVVGHQEKNYLKEVVGNPHEYRAYCIPEQTPQQ